MEIKQLDNVYIIDTKIADKFAYYKDNCKVTIISDFNDVTAYVFVNSTDFTVAHGYIAFDRNGAEVILQNKQNLTQEQIEFYNTVIADAIVELDKYCGAK